MTTAETQNSVVYEAPDTARAQPASAQTAQSRVSSIFKRLVYDETTGRVKTVDIPPPAPSLTPEL